LCSVLGNVMKTMAKTITKKDLVDRIADKTGNKRVIVKKIVQNFLDEIVQELGDGNRLEFRDFGVFEIRSRAARVAQNPKTMEKVYVPSKRTVKFKVGRLMKQKLFADEEGPQPQANQPSASEAV
jgi:integration host factor subunit beta